MLQTVPTSHSHNYKFNGCSRVSHQLSVCETIYLSAGQHTGRFRERLFRTAEILKRICFTSPIYSVDYTATQVTKASKIIVVSTHTTKGAG